MGNQWSRDKVTNTTIIVVIVTIGLAAAYVLFGVLSSGASGEFQGYSVTGAIAGFVVVETLLFAAYQQLRKSDEADLQKRIEELQQKLIRGAPRPQGFETEVSERERIVLARPQGWLPKGGIIFNFRAPLTDEQKGLTFSVRQRKIPAEFQCSYERIPEEYFKQHAKNDVAEEFYRNFMQRVEDSRQDPDGYIQALYSERVLLGDPIQPTKSLKIVSKEYGRIVIDSMNTRLLSRDDAFQWESTSSSEFTELSSNNGQEESSAFVDGQQEGDEQYKKDEEPNATVLPVEVMHASISCFHTGLKTIYYFDFWDDPVDFAQSSEKFNQILSSVRFLG